LNGMPLLQPIPEHLPSATPPAELAVFALPTGVTHRVAAFAYAGGSFRDRRDFAMTGVLVKHPGGDLLIDTGFGRRIDRPRLIRRLADFDAAGNRANLLHMAAIHDRFPELMIVPAHDSRGFAQMPTLLGTSTIVQ